MREYASITLSMLEYASIYLKKQSAEYGTILNVSDAVDIIRSLYKLLSSHRDRAFSQHCQTFKMERFGKRLMRNQKCFRLRLGDVCGTVAL